MKHAIINLYKKHCLSLILLTCTAILIWINGPLIKIGQSIPLLDPAKRAYTITLIFLLWVLKYIFIDSVPSKNASIEKPQSPEAQKKAEHLQGRFQGALDFLKKTTIEKQGKQVNLANLPWYLLIGPTSAGKTTLLANANIPFILSKQFKMEPTQTISSSDQCDWWVTRDAVLVDIPGTYLNSKMKDSPLSAIFHFLWKHLLRLINTTRSKHHLQGIVIALNLPEMIKQDRSQKNQIIYDLKKRINELTESVGKSLPIHLVITKCDLLPGFTEFFSECSSDEITQPWGITLDKSNESLIDTFSNRFNILIKRINKQLIWRMHQERNPQARPYIKDFPLHLERLKESITQFLKAMKMPTLSIQSVHLTSSAQDYHDEETTYVAASGTPAHFNNQALQILSTPPTPSRSYFVRQLILNHLHRNTTAALETALTPKQHWQKRIMYACSTAIIVTSAFLLGHDFQYSVQQAYSIQNDLNHYQLSTQGPNPEASRLMNALTLLNALQQASFHPGDKMSLAYYSKKSQQTAASAYQQALQTLLLPDIKNNFETYLQSTNGKNPENVYAILKAYLMLGSKENINTDYLAKSLQSVLPTPMSQETTVALSQHIQSAIQHASSPLKLNDDLITVVRKQLTELPTTTLAFVILKNMGNNNMDSPISLGTHSSVFATKSIETIIPSMYTADHFQKILSNESILAATEATQGNWVLGMNLIVTSQSTINALTTQLRTQYVANYVDLWESLLANIELNIPRNLPEMNTLLTTLTSDHSPLLQLLNTIKENTSFAPVLEASPKLQELGILLVEANNHDSSTLYHIFSSLKNVHRYLNDIVTLPDSSKAIFEASARRIQDPTQDPLTQLEAIAEESPDPIKTWLTSITQQSWHFLLQDSARYIDAAWQKDIAPIYHSQLADRYPFNQNAPEEVSLAQFTAFLGPQGSMANFYQHYIKPFVTEKNNTLEWNTIDNQKIPLSDEVLAQFSQAASLQRVFFPNGDNKLYVQFSLQPVSLDSTSKQFSLNVNGQQLDYQPSKDASSRMLSWPGNNPAHSAQYQFVSTSNQLISDSLKGDWGWFKLVTSATQTINSRKEIVLNFSNGTHSAKYLLFTQGHLNPFLPLNLTHFQLPDKLGQS